MARRLRPTFGNKSRLVRTKMAIVVNAIPGFAVVLVGSRRDSQTHVWCWVVPIKSDCPRSDWCLDMGRVATVTFVIRRKPILRSLSNRRCGHCGSRRSRVLPNCRPWKSPNSALANHTCSCWSRTHDDCHATHQYFE